MDRECEKAVQELELGLSKFRPEAYPDVFRQLVITTTEKELQTLRQSRQAHSDMKAVDFYYMPSCPSCRAAEMVASVVGVKLNKHYINLWKGDHLKEDYLKINPQHKVPFIIDGDLKLGESRAIMAYFVNRYKLGDPLYPNDTIQRAAVDEMLFFDATTLYPSYSKLVRPILFEGKRGFDLENLKAYHQNLEYIESRLANNGGGRFLFGDNLTIADISLCAQIRLELPFDYDMSKLKRLAVYIDHMKATIPDYSKINDEGVKDLISLIRTKLEQ